MKLKMLLQKRKNDFKHSSPRKRQIKFCGNKNHNTLFFELVHNLSPFIIIMHFRRQRQLQIYFNLIFLFFNFMKWKYLFYIFFSVFIFVSGSASTFHHQRPRDGYNTIDTSTIFPFNLNGKWGEPYFDISVPNNVTALVGKSAYLSCRVKNLGNKTVSIKIKKGKKIIITVFFHEVASIV